MNRISNSLFEAITKVTTEGKGDGNLANNYPPYDKVTRGDVIAGRLGKDQMGGKKKIKEELMQEDLELELNENELELFIEEILAERDEGKPGKMFAKIAAKAAKRYGSKEAGNRVAGAIRKKVLAKEEAITEVKDTENILPKDAPAPVSKNPSDKENKSAMAKQVAVQKEETVEEASKGNAFDWKGKPSSITADARSAFTKKKVSTGTIYNRKPEKTTGASGVSGKKNAMKEGISQTIINHGDFTLEVVDNPTYGDYLNALQSMINTNEETVQQEIITIAQEAYKEKVESIIIEASARASFKTRLNEFRTSGAKVLEENYIVELDEPYVEYVIEQNGVRTQYVHSGTVKKV